MLNRETLEAINNIMLSRGVPDKRDDTGYNVADYKVLSPIWNGATDNDLYEISSRLLKYYDTQLKGMSIVFFSKEELEESIKYYKELSEQSIVKHSITIGFEDNYKTVYVSFKYNDNYIKIMRKYRYKFDKDTKAWKGESNHIKLILSDLKDLGADIENSLKYIEKIETENSIVFSISKDEETGEDITKTIEVEEIDEDNITLKFDFDNSLVEEIKKLKSKKFDWESKIWIINKFEAKTLYENILYLGYDLSSLKKYISESTKIKLRAKKINDLDIELSFPYYPEIIENIKKLSFYSFNRPKSTWIIDIREKDILTELIKDLIDTEELEEIISKEIEKVDLKDYSYLKRKPYNHQLEAANFLLEKRKALIGDEMGTGKTLSSILASFSLPSPRLIICPASLKLNWAKEIRMVDDRGKISVIGDESTKLGSDWYIINYDILEREYNKLKNMPFTSITLDEAHYIKSITNGGKPNSKRANYSMKLASKCNYVFTLTGTPITNKPKDIFNILKISDHILSRNYFSFAQSYCGATHNGFGWNFEGSSNEEELHEKIKPMMIRRLKKNMLDLPEKIRRFIPVEINMNSYHEAVEEYIKKRNTLTSDGEHLAYLGTIKHILAKEKITSTIEIAENILDGDESVVIFTNYNAVVDRIMSHFKEIATKITGSCSAKNREQAVEDFQAGRKKVMVANIIAGGVGLTLVKANNLIFNDFDWIPANHFQAEDRIHRIGQTRNATINYLYVNGAEIDEYMADMLERKSTYINKIVDGGKGDQLSIVKEIIKNLYRVA
ncbi:MAG: SNF2-related protein [Bacilli bacterium]|nr:SNF2-related protein [Bacilli bacterium]